MIETPRLLLRPHVLGDFEASYAISADPEVVRYIGGTPMSREDAWARLLRFAGHWALAGHGIFAVVEKAGGTLLGEVGLADFKRGLGAAFDGTPEGAWVFAAAAQGRGYALEATRAAHDWYDARHGAGRRVCIIDPDNVRSLKLAAALGYRPFGGAIYKNHAVTMLERGA